MNMDGQGNCMGTGSNGEKEMDPISPPPTTPNFLIERSWATEPLCIILVVALHSRPLIL